MILLDLRLNMQAPQNCFMLSWSFLFPSFLVSNFFASGTSGVGVQHQGIAIATWGIHHGITASMRGLTHNSNSLLVSICVLIIFCEVNKMDSFEEVFNNRKGRGPWYSTFWTCFQTRWYFGCRTLADFVTVFVRWIHPPNSDGREVLDFLSIEKDSVRSNFKNRKLSNMYYTYTCT